MGQNDGEQPTGIPAATTTSGASQVSVVNSSRVRSRSGDHATNEGNPFPQSHFHG